MMMLQQYIVCVLTILTMSTVVAFTVYPTHEVKSMHAKDLLTCRAFESDGELYINKCRTRRKVFQTLTISTACLAVVGFEGKKANAAPPIAIIAQELGYFPITNRQGITQYIPARVKRASTDQSTELAKYLRSKGVKMYGTYWCGHTSHQKELFGKEAWEYIDYVECSPKGAYFDADKLAKVGDNIDGFPTWYIPKSKEKWVSGEMPLETIAALSAFKGKFDVQLEGPGADSAGAC